VHLLQTGLNHKTAPLDVRERVAFSKEQLAEALPLLKERVGECILLSTCNRTEIYASAEKPAGAAADIRRFVADYHSLDRESVNAQFEDRTDIDAVRHLFRVSSGLDSMILGESEILGQVRGAMTVAGECHTLGALVSRLFHRAIRTGRRVRQETGLGRNALSAGYVAVKLAQRVLGDLGELRVLLIGAGEAGQLVARALRASGAGDLMIANRTAARGLELAESLDGTAVPFQEVGSWLENVDVAITAIEADEFLLTREGISAATQRRNGRAMFLFDLAVPRNIEPDAASVDNVSLFNIDDLSSMVEDNRAERREAAAEAEKIVEEEIGGFMAWWESLEAVPLIKALHQRAERIRLGELERALRKLDDLSAEEAEVVDAMTRSLVNRMLHDPTVSLKQRSDEALLKAARELFGL
jgi:glutamyl-tRNA reductase